MSGEYNRSSANGDEGSPSQENPVSPSAAAAAATTTSAPSTSDGPQTPHTSAPIARPKVVDDVLSSDIGISTLLTRLKQSIASARDFANFLKKRSKLEEEASAGLKALARSQAEGLRRGEGRGETYARQVAEVMRTHERLADHGMQFALSLHQMHEDLSGLAASMERARKEAKHDGLDAEKRAADAEAAMAKAKAKYDGLAEDYDRARTGDTKAGRRIGLKGPKSAEQYEGELQRKLAAADQEYQDRVRAAQQQRRLLVTEQRPRFINMLTEKCRECDAGLALQLQKLAAFNEKLLLGNGLAVSPLPTDGDDNRSNRSLRDIVADIDNEADFHAFVGGHVGKIPARPSEIQYEPHPTLAPKTQQPTIAQQQQPQQPPPPSLTVNTGGPSQSGSTASRYGGGAVHSAASASAYGTGMAFQQQAGQLSSYGQTPSTAAGSGYTPQFSPVQQQQAYNISQQHVPPPNARETGYPTPPYPTSAGEQRGSGYPPPTTTVAGGGSAIALPSQQQARGGGPGAGPVNPVFGVSLEELFARDQTPVPMVVSQCIMAVDHFGLEVEGIYRMSGTSSHVTALREAFTNQPPHTPLDLRHPAAFYHDVNSVATLLKQFFRDLPDPLIPGAAYGTFMQAARLDDPSARRDALHQAINDLPDPHYATLRALVLHLHRVMRFERVNRMGSASLAVCFAPSLMGTHTGSQIADASLQARVLQTILENATAIFDED